MALAGPALVWDDDFLDFSGIACVGVLAQIKHDSLRSTVLSESTIAHLHKILL